MLSEYYVYRFAKAEDGGGYGSDGELRKPSWKRVTQVRVPGISKQEAARTVRELNRDTLPVAKKRASLSDDEQRQIELVLEDLQRGDNAWFQTTLVQLDDQLRVVNGKDRDKDRGRAFEKEKGRDRRSSKHRQEYHILLGGRKMVYRRPASRAREAKKPPATERVTLTAYYKRSPRPEVDPIPLLQRAQQRVMQPVMAQQTARPMDGQYSQPQAPINPNFPRQPMALAAGGCQAERRPSVGNHARADGEPAVTIVQPTAQHSNGADRRNRSPHRRPPSPHSRHQGPPSTATNSSSVSDVFSILDDESFTSPSTDSYDSSPHASFVRLSPRRAHGAGPLPERQVHYGVSPCSSPPHHHHPGGSGGIDIQPHRTNLHRRPGTTRGRRHSMSSHYPSYLPTHQASSPTQARYFPPTSSENMPGMVATAPQAPMPPSPAATGLPDPVTAQQIAENAYAKGRADTREEAINLAERIAGVAAATATAAAAATATNTNTNGNATEREVSSPPPRRPQVISLPYRGRERDRDRDRDRVRIVPGVGVAARDRYAHPHYKHHPRQDVEVDSGDLDVGYDDYDYEYDLDFRAHADDDGGDEELLFEERGPHGYVRVPPAAGRWDRDRDRVREYRVVEERLRRGAGEDERRAAARERDEYLGRRRDSGIDVGTAAFGGDSNPFASRPGLGRRISAGPGYSSGYKGRLYD
jgi:hypothetical protein